ncbi:MAG: flagellar hook-length control protein FliK [Candidatus Goldbacteria bacterium]|nr:flagellar hook-length control protein FliK [Candidatus Goldiibacteriota bacterium]
MVNLNLSMLSLNMTGMPMQAQGVSPNGTPLANNNIATQEQAASFRLFVTGLISNTNTESFEAQKTAVTSLLDANTNLKTAVYTAVASLDMSGDLVKLAAQPKEILASNPVVLAVAEKLSLNAEQKELFINAVKVALIEVAAKQISSSLKPEIAAAENGSKQPNPAVNETSIKSSGEFNPAAVQPLNKLQTDSDTSALSGVKTPKNNVPPVKAPATVEIPLTPKLKETTLNIKQAVDDLRAALGSFITEKFEGLKNEIQAPSNITPDINSLVLFQAGMVEIAKISSMAVQPVVNAAASESKTVQLPMTPGRLADYTSKQMTQAVNVIVMAADAAAVPVVQAASALAGQKTDVKPQADTKAPVTPVMVQADINKEAKPAVTQNPVNQNILYTAQDSKVRTVTIAVPFEGNNEQLTAVKEATSQVKEAVSKIINLINEMNGELQVIKQSAAAVKNTPAPAPAPVSQQVLMPEVKANISAEKPAVSAAAQQVNIEQKSAPAVTAQQAPAAEVKAKPEIRLMPGVTKQEVEAKVKEDVKWLVDNSMIKVKNEIETVKVAKNLMFENIADVSNKTKETLVIKQLTENIDKLPSVSEKTVIKIDLKPENLGNVTIRLESEGRTVKAMIQVANAEVKETLKAGLAELRTSLENKGIEVANMNITVMNNSESAYGNGNFRQAPAYVKPETNMLKNAAEAENNKPVSSDNGTGVVNLLA